TLWPCIAYQAPHCGVSEGLAIVLDGAQVQAHELRHSVDLIIAETQTRENAACNVRAEARMVIKGVPPVVCKRMRRWLADVVQQRRSPGDQVGGSEFHSAQRVLIDVVPMKAALFYADHGDDLGQHALQQPAEAQHLEAGAWMRGHEHPPELVAHALHAE